MEGISPITVMARVCHGRGPAMCLIAVAGLLTWQLDSVDFPLDVQLIQRGLSFESPLHRSHGNDFLNISGTACLGGIVCVTVFVGFLKFLADTCPFIGATGTPVLDFW